MKLTVLLFIATLFYGVSFYMHAFVKRTAKTEHLMDFFPMLALVYLLTQTMFITQVNAFRLMILFLVLGYDIIKVLELRRKPLPIIPVGVLFTLCYIAILKMNVSVPIFIVNNLNLLLAAAYFGMAFYSSKRDESIDKKELMEIDIIAFIGIMILSVSKTYFMHSVAVGIIVLHQLAKMIIYTKHEYNLHHRLLRRLEELENRFDRTVEFEAKKRTSVLSETIEHIREKSQKDPMTKALNRHGLTSEINDLIRDPGVRMFSIALFDIDHFKSINDTKGHIVGDECLKFLSYTFMVNLRKTDMLGRYGGDEFIVIMPHVNAPQALENCERLRKMIQTKSAPKFTISMGVATYPYDGRAFTALLEIADKGLYKAKESGRNRVDYAGNVFIKPEETKSL